MARRKHSWLDNIKHEEIKVNLDVVINGKTKKMTSVNLTNGKIASFTLDEGKSMGLAMSQMVLSFNDGFKECMEAYEKSKVVA